MVDKKKEQKTLIKSEINNLPSRMAVVFMFDLKKLRYYVTSTIKYETLLFFFTCI